ncbi:MAG: hypothetical protein IJ429_06020 [Lachnospiraceae bacterium]|nr:hypothetical protein [Lachnospiraceae bacterium]
MKELVAMAIVAVIFILPFVLVAIDIILFVKKKEKWWFEAIAFACGGIYMILAYILWDLPDYNTPLNIHDVIHAHAPFASEHLPSLMLFAVWGVLSYILLKFTRKKLPPLMEVFFLAGIYVGIALCAVFVFQLICLPHPLPARMGDVFPDAANPDALYYIRIGPSDIITILCLCAVPLLYMIHVIVLMVCIVKEKAEKQKELRYNNPVLQKINCWLLSGANLFWGAVVALLPVLGILVGLLILFGQQPDSIIKVFTQTSDWVLSGEISPPPVAYDTHYLCTVSLRGHKKIVKPLRYGIRRGEKIVVNRQLCVANAFEQLLEEKAPHLHRKIRRFYDTYGYPVSRHINTAWAADIVYILMKPLEWFFVAVLYLVDPKPENRINSQYMPKPLQ